MSELVEVSLIFGSKVRSVIPKKGQEKEEDRERNPTSHELDLMTSAVKAFAKSYKGEFVRSTSGKGQRIFIVKVPDNCLENLHTALAGLNNPKLEEKAPPNQRTVYWPSFLGLGT